MKESTWNDEVMSDKEQAEMWASVAKTFDDLLTEIREIAENAIDNTPYEAQHALQKIVRLIGEPSYQDAEQ